MELRLPIVQEFAMDPMSVIVLECVLEPVCVIAMELVVELLFLIVLEPVVEMLSRFVRFVVRGKRTHQFEQTGLCRSVWRKCSS